MREMVCVSAEPVIKAARGIVLDIGPGNGEVCCFISRRNIMHGGLISTSGYMSSTNLKSQRSMASNQIVIIMKV